LHAVLFPLFTLLLAYSLSVCFSPIPSLPFAPHLFLPFPLLLTIPLLPLLHTYTLSSLCSSPISALPFTP
jgi:hypothetical protein